MAIFYNPNKKKGLFFMPSGATGGERLSIEYSAARFCENGVDPIAGITGETGGTFSSTTGLVFISTSTGQVDLSASTIGTYIVTYTAPSSETATTSISVDSIPVVSAGSDVAICNGENTILTATGATTYSWSTGQTGASITVDPTTDTTYIVTGFNGACSDTDSVDVTVNAQDSAAFSYAASAFCANGTDPSPTITGTAGGAFTSTAGITLNSSTGEIDLDASTVGTYSITYTTTGVCPANQSTNITINAADNAAFSYSASSYEPTDSDPTPTITGLTGGTFSGTTGLVINSTTGEIDLSASTVASHTITYDTTSSGSSVCPNTSTQTVEIALAGIANNYSMSFDGTNDYIDAGTGLGNDLGTYTGDLTISLWFNANDTNSNKGIFYIGSFSNAAGELQYNLYQHNLIIRVDGNGNNATKTISSITNNVNYNTTWNNLVFVYKSGDITNSKIYLNNVEITATDSGTFPSSLSFTGLKTIIGAYYGSAYTFNGKIDEVAVWDTALTDGTGGTVNQIAEIYNATGTNLTKDLTTVSGSNLKYWNRMGD